MTRLAIAGGVLLLLGLTIVLWYWQIEQSAEEQEITRSWAMANSQVVQEGMTIDEARNSLAGAWHESVCDAYNPPVTNYSIHLFFFGSQRIDRVATIGVRLGKEDGREVVTQVFKVQSYRLEGQYQSCLDEDPGAPK